MDNLQFIRIGILTMVSFVTAFSLTPLMTRILYKYKLGKNVRDESANTPVFTKMHKKKIGTPTMGGVIIWGTVVLLALFFYIVGHFFPSTFISELNFLTRSQTWLPLGVMVATALVGLVDDYFNVKKIGPKGGGLSMGYKSVIYLVIAMIGAYWFYVKLAWDVIHVPFLGNFEIGPWYIPIFIFIVFATAFSVNEIDGLDGLAGGTLLYAFLAYGAISFLQGKYELSAFCGVIVGALLAFLWFNINPARFFMGDTGSMSLGVTLALIAMLTNSALLLPIIGFLFVIESMSVIIQIVSKKLRNGKRVFLSAPIHHHFEAIGWTEPKIVMRFWIIATVTSLIGVVLAFIDYQLFR